MQYEIQRIESNTDVSRKAIFTIEGRPRVTVEQLLRSPIDFQPRPLKSVGVRH